jgi:hypothetical protein
LRFLLPRWKTISHHICMIKIYRHQRANSTADFILFLGFCQSWCGSARFKHKIYGLIQNISQFELIFKFLNSF